MTPCLFCTLPSNANGAALGRAWAAVNWPHLLLLAALPPGAWLAHSWPPDLTLAVLTGAALAWLMLCERLWPLRADWHPSPAEMARDGAFLGLNGAVNALVAAGVTGLVLRYAGDAPQGTRWAATLHPALALPLAIALGELGPYALHRWAHSGGWLWRIHALHHRPTKLNTLNAVLSHPLNAAWNQLARLLPWLALGVDAHVALWAAVFLQVQGLAVHANLRGSLGPLNRLIGSAELHRWHHSDQPTEALNFGTALPLWDQLLGSYRWRPGQVPQRLGTFQATSPEA